MTNKWHFSVIGQVSLIVAVVKLLRNFAVQYVIIKTKIRFKIVIL